jgi:hypothetical protein
VRVSYAIYGCQYIFLEISHIEIALDQCGVEHTHIA